MPQNIFMIRHKPTGAYIRTNKSAWMELRHAKAALRYYLRWRKKYDSKDNYEVVEFELKEVKVHE